MSWITQNLLWIVLAVGVVFFLMRRGGMGCSHGSHRQHGDSTQHDSSQKPTTPPSDPVSGQTVDTAAALTSVYQGQTYYFATRENLDLFNATPDEYAAKAQEKGHSHSGNRHGCC